MLESSESKQRFFLMLRRQGGTVPINAKHLRFFPSPGKAPEVCFCFCCVSLNYNPICYCAFRIQLRLLFPFSLCSRQLLIMFRSARTKLRPAEVCALRPLAHARLNPSVTPSWGRALST